MGNLKLNIVYGFSLENTRNANKYKIKILFSFFFKLGVFTRTLLLLKNVEPKGMKYI